MSNAQLRKRLERLPAPVVAALIDLGHAKDYCGVLEFSYYGYCYPGQVIAQARDLVSQVKEVPVPEMKRVRERL